MPFVDADRVRETTTTTGTGNVTLAGAVSGARTFSSVMANGDTCHYVITDNTAWEVGLGTYNTSGNTLSRTQVFSSSNSGNLVSLSAGTKQVFISFAANRVALDRDIGQAANQVPLNAYLGTLAYQDAAAVAVGQLRASSASGIGYATGAGGAFTQPTSKATGVTLNAACGQVTTAADALAASTVVSFVLTNSSISAGDVLVLNHLSGGTLGAYTLNARSAAGSATIDIRNVTAGSLSEALVIAFAVIKAVTT